MIHIGIIGAGNIAHKFAEAIIKSDLNGDLYAIASRDLEKAKSFKKEHKAKKAYGSYQELFEDDLVDLVYIATPHTLHFEQIIQALDYNKHVLCEKPMTINESMAQTVFNKAKEKNLFVMEAMWTRCLPVIQKVQDNIKKGMIGHIKRLEADFCMNPSIDKDHRLYQPHLGGGALLDIGIYPITIANIFLGKPDIIHTDVQMADTNVDISEEITYIYPASTGFFKVAFNQSRPREARIFGTKGKIIIDGLNDTESAKVYDENDQEIKHIHIPFETNGFEYEIREAIRCIEKNHLESSIIPHSATLSVLSQMDQIRKEWGLVYPQEK